MFWEYRWDLGGTQRGSMHLTKDLWGWAAISLGIPECYMHTSTYTQMLASVHTHWSIRTSIGADMCIHLNIHIHTLVHAHASTPAHLSVNIHVPMQCVRAHPPTHPHTRSVILRTVLCKHPYSCDTERRKSGQ